MSVLVVVQIPADTEKFTRSLVDRAADYERISGDARKAGALHHRFGTGNGHVLVVDEWESGKQFADFFSRPELQAFIVEVGGDLTFPPDTIITEAVTSPDQF